MRTSYRFHTIFTFIDNKRSQKERGNMSRKNKHLPEVVNALPAKSGKGKKFVKFVVVASAIAAGAHFVSKVIKENKELMNSDFQGEQHIYRFTGHEIIKKEGETVPNMRLVTTFGGMYVDISKATIDSDISFEIDSLFSGLSIRIPEGLNVQVDCTGTGSGVSAPDTVYEGAPTLFISGRNRYSGLSVFVKPDDVSTEQNQ